MSFACWEFLSGFLLLQCAGGQQRAMDTTSSMKMTSLAVQSLFSYMEEEDLAAVKAHLDKFRDVDCRSDVSHPVSQQAPCLLRKVREDYRYEVMRGFLRLCNKCSVGERIFTTELQCFKKVYDFPWAGAFKDHYFTYL